MSDNSKKLAPYQDLPGIGHIFADSMQRLRFDGQLAHVTLTVTRHEENQAGDTQIKRYTAARLILTPQLIMALHKQFSQLVDLINADTATKGSVPASSTVQ